MDRTKFLEQFDTILDINSKTFADDFRKAIGLNPGDSLEILTPQFDRVDGIKPARPGDKRFFDALKKLPHDDLIALGLGLWEDNHYLYPWEWYDFIPPGYEVHSISGEKEEFVHGKTDDDKRFGMLSFGFKKEYEKLVNDNN